jgi:pimeloyl-ACP methyl ester carboxylesterase
MSWRSTCPASAAPNAERGTAGGAARPDAPTLFTPVQIVAGRWDPLVPLANADYLHARLPNSRLDVLDTGHFAWEEAPEQYAAIVTAWVNGGYLAGSAGHQW